MSDIDPEKNCDRPLECGECRKPVAVRYTEIAEGTITHTCMCSDCPQLEQRLHGISSAQASLLTTEGATGLVCGNCGMTLANVRMGTSLGCSHCYEVFADVILAELRAANKIPAMNAKKVAVVHLGRTPGELVEISASSRLAALNEALGETLTQEDYEQAAWLRDQIKKLTEKSDAQESEGKQ